MNQTTVELLESTGVSLEASLGSIELEARVNEAIKTAIKSIDEIFHRFTVAQDFQFLIQALTLLKMAQSLFHAHFFVRMEIAFGSNENPTQQARDIVNRHLLDRCEKIREELIDLFDE